MTTSKAAPSPFKPSTELRLGDLVTVAKDSHRIYMISRTGSERLQLICVYDRSSEPGNRWADNTHDSIRNLVKDTCGIERYVGTVTLTCEDD